MHQAEHDPIQNHVVDGGYCVGCGACAFRSERYRMELNKYGMYQPRLVDSGAVGAEAAFRTCPFGAGEVNEDDIAEELFGGDTPYLDGVGRYRGVYAGFVEEDDFRDNGSSGGLGSWLLVEMMRCGMVDAVLHVKPQAYDPKNRGPLFAYGISKSIEEVRAASKSRYYPIELSQILEEVKRSGKRYAVTGLPCFIKTLRLLCREDAKLKQQLVFFIGLVCGHLKSTTFADFFAWQAGITPGQLKAVDFRHKLEGRSANRYAIRLESKSDDQPIVRPMDSFFGHTWGLGLFKNPACDFCDDVFAETADITIGDAWLPQYVKDVGGTNVVVVRNAQLQALILEGMQSSRIKLDSLQAEDAYRSQEAGLRHRRQGLAHRLFMKGGRWFPKKRVEATQEPDRRYRRIFEIRQCVAVKSHELFYQAVQNNGIEQFLLPMKKMSAAYDLLYSRYTRGWVHRLPMPILLKLGALKALMVRFFK